MLHYPLEWCEKAGFESIIVLTLSEHHAAIQSYLRSHRVTKVANTPLYVQCHAASSMDDNLSSADVVRIAFQKGWITQDVCVLPCDLVTNLEGSRLAELWMATQAGFDGDLGRVSRKYASAGDGEDGRRGGLTVWYQTMGEGAVKGQETDFVAATPLLSPPAIGTGLPDGDIGTLLTTAPSTSLKGLNEIPIRHSMLAQFPDTKIYATFRDAGIYFLPFWALKFLERNPMLSSLREDVLPWIAKARWQSPKLARKLGITDILAGTEPAGPNTENDSNDVPYQRYDIGSLSSTRSRRSKNPPIPSIIAYLPSAPSVFMRRVDTVHLYLFTSLHLAKSDPTAPSALKIDPSANIGERTNITALDCLVAEKASIGDRAVIKKTVIGAGCSIGRGVRLTGCLLMDGASVAENSKLEGCIIGRKANIGAKVSLKDCEVADSFFVDDGTEAKNERFLHAMEQATDDEEGESDDGDYEYSESGEETDSAETSGEE
ncbi:hypothetical protein EX30DRAFT_354045 [Ascodesmis nigricans]|uniref:Translation initiation factor eIF2B subunit gamma n=1 Tax=Ascodesmis nigricans TaxID=341454 RepID=A0A4S2N530_9PEZI|nr:hypothetical protein EX30DRAFT_354045 [Ascodesmis nigricans]